MNTKTVRNIDIPGLCAPCTWPHTLDFWLRQMRLAGRHLLSVLTVVDICELSLFDKVFVGIKLPVANGRTP